MASGGYSGRRDGDVLNRDTEAWKTTIVFGHIEYKQIIAQTLTARQNGLELPVIDKPFLFWKCKPLQKSTTFEINLN